MGQVRAPVHMNGKNSESYGQLRELKLRDETAADTNSVFAKLLGPDPLQADANRRKNGNVENGKKGVWNSFGTGEIEGHSAKSQIDNAGAVRRLVAQNGVRVGAGHGDAFCFTRDGKDAGFHGRNGETWLGCSKRRNSWRWRRWSSADLGNSCCWSGRLC